MVYKIAALICGAVLGTLSMSGFTQIPIDAIPYAVPGLIAVMFALFFIARAVQGPFWGVLLPSYAVALYLQAGLAFLTAFLFALSAYYEQQMSLLGVWVLGTILVLLVLGTIGLIVRLYGTLRTPAAAAETPAAK